jgi:hypothetical protein
MRMRIRIRILASVLRLKTLKKVLKLTHIPYILACRLQIDADAYPDPDPAYHFDPDPDPAFQFYANPDSGSVTLN